MNKSSFYLALIALVGVYVVTGLTFFLIKSDVVGVSGVKEPYKEVTVVSEPSDRKVVIDTQPAEKPKKKEEVRWAYYIKDPIPSEIIKSDTNLIIIDVENENVKFNADIVNPMKVPNRTVLGYASLGEAENYRSYWKDSWNKKRPPFLAQKENPLWKGNFKVTDLMSKEWTDVSKGVIDSMIEKDFDGILISGVSGKDANLYIQRVSEYAKKKNPNFKIYVQDYSDAEIIEFVDGIVKQYLVHNINGVKAKDNVIAKEISKLNEFKESGKNVLVIEYEEDEKLEVTKKIADKNKYSLYSGPIELNIIRKQK